MKSAAIPHKIKLQINTAGAWRDVPSGKTSLRLCSDDGLHRALIHWTAEKGWVAV